MALNTRSIRAGTVVACAAALCLPATQPAQDHHHHRSRGGHHAGHAAARAAPSHHRHRATHGQGGVILGYRPRPGERRLGAATVHHGVSVAGYLIAPYAYRLDAYDGYCSAYGRNVVIRPAGIDSAASPDPVAPLVAAEELANGILRLRWTDDGRGAREVALFVADSGGRITSTQTVRAAPYTALFDVAALRPAFIGVTVVSEDGARSTTFRQYPLP